MTVYQTLLGFNDLEISEKCWLGIFVEHPSTGVCLFSRDSTEVKNLGEDHAGKVPFS